jgi:DNA polymerase-3 subunit alpha
MSSLDGCATIASYVKEAAKRGNKGIGITDHGTMRGYLQLHDECEKVNIKPVYGVEFYLCSNMNRKGLTRDEKDSIISGKNKLNAKIALSEYEKLHKIRERTHLTVFAKDNIGMKNLYKLTSMSYIDGFYYRPRIDFDALIKHNDGLIIATGCLGSELNQNWLKGQKRIVMELADKLHGVFKDRFFLEIQPHSIEGQWEANKLALSLRERFSDCRLLMTQDTHYVKREHAVPHECMLCVGTHNVMSDPSRFRFPNNDFFMKTQSEILGTFRNNHSFIPEHLLKEAMDSTIDIIDMCDVSLELNPDKPLLPVVHVPNNLDPKTFLKDVCYASFAEKILPKITEEHYKYKQRLEYELKIINDHNFTDYFLIVKDIYNFAAENDIMVGPGRGSVAGSLVAYLLGLTMVDPIKHDLMFERFINKDRIDFPDIDCDFQDNKRKFIFEYIKQKYGEDKVCHITTIGKLNGRSCLKDVSRALEIPYVKVNKITKHLIERDSGDERFDKTIIDSFEQNEECIEFNKEYPEVLENAKVLEGLSKTLGYHAAGIIVSSVCLDEVLPLEVRKSGKENTIVSALDLHGVARLGLVKLDILGLKTLTILKDIIDVIKDRHGIEINLEEIDLEDKKVLKGFSDNDFIGVFQFDSISSRRVCDGFNFESFEDIAALNALMRPGTMRSGLTQIYLDRKKNKNKEIKDVHPVILDITKETLGVITYQEQVIKILMNVAGYTASEADIIRKLISKSVGAETLNKERDKFTKGAIENVGMSEEEANSLMDDLVEFGGYSFNKSHSTAYSMISYFTMYFKKHYPLEFFYSALKNEKDIDKINEFVKAANRIGIEIFSPTVNLSKEGFIIDKDVIIGSLLDIKSIGPKAAETIVQNQPYKDIIDFLDRVNRRAVTKKTLKVLTSAGALNDFLPNQKYFIENFDSLFETLSKDKEKFKCLIDSSINEPMWSKDECLIHAAKINPIALQQNIIHIYQNFIEEHIVLPIVKFDDDGFYEDNHEKIVLIACTIIVCKPEQIGDYYSGNKFTDKEKQMKFFGNIYANVIVEGKEGIQRRVKFDHEIYQLYKHVIELDSGSPVFILAKANKVYKNIQAFYITDLEKLRNNLKSNEKIDIFEKIIIGEKSVKKTLRGLSDSAIVTKAKGNRKRKVDFYGVVLKIRRHYDKNNNQMGFFEMIDGSGNIINCICFSSIWSYLRISLKIGLAIKIPLVKKKNFYEYQGGEIIRLRIKE